MENLEGCYEKKLQNQRSSAGWAGVLRLLWDNQFLGALFHPAGHVVTGNRAFREYLSWDEYSV
ncbi:hypothetical protein STRDD10_01159 [Streptococcus sp. DD10]|nr:hypothetical protein STRDD10_01159 [Streptococcus sp. DD10]